MTLHGLTRLRIADLVIELPADLSVSDPEVLAANLGPFVDSSTAPPDIVVESGALPLGVVPSTADSFRVDVNRIQGLDIDHPTVKPYWLTETSSGIRVRGALKNALEVVAGIHLGLAHLLPKRDGLLLHASAARAAGWAFVFAGPAESGKSTAANRFDGGRVLADERVAVRRAQNRWSAYPVPMWGGKYQPVSADVVPLAMLVVVRKNAPLAASALPATSGLTRLAPAVVHNHYDGARADRVLGALAALATEVPVVELAWGLGDSFAETLLGRVPRAQDARAAGGS
jgi:hypothetical protein